VHHRAHDAEEPQPVPTVFLLHMLARSMTALAGLSGGSSGFVAAAAAAAAAVDFGLLGCLSQALLLLSGE